MKITIQLVLLTGLLATMSSVTSCQQLKKSGPKKTPSGYPIEFHKDEPGTTAKVGDQVTYMQLVAIGDSILYTTEYSLEPLKAVLPPKDSAGDPVRPDYEALLMMSPGDSVTVLQPLSKIKKLPKYMNPKDTMIYSQKLISITPAAEVKKQFALLNKRAESVADSVRFIMKFIEGEGNYPNTSIKNGVMMITHREGTGPEIQTGSQVKIHFAGFLKNGAEFDNSWRRHYPFLLNADKKQIIPGVDKVLVGLKQGAVVTLFVPYPLGYGSQGAPKLKIPPDTDLVFYLEVLSVR